MPSEILPHSKNSLLFYDSDYDSSDCEEQPPSDGPAAGPASLPIDGPPLPTPAPIVKPPPKSDKNHEVKPKESFLKSSRVLGKRGRWKDLRFTRPKDP